MSESASAIERLFHRVMLALGRGRITTVNDSGPVQMAQVRVSAFETRDNLPRLAEFGFTSNPPIGSDAMLGFIGGDRSNGAVIGTNHQASRPRGLAIGESMLFNAGGIQVYLTNGGLVVNAAAMPITVNNCTTATVNASVSIIANTPLVKCSGDVIDNYATNSHSMAQMRTIFNTHTHNDPQGGTVAIPNALM